MILSIKAKLSRELPGHDHALPWIFLLLVLGMLLSGSAFAQTAQNARDADRGSQILVNAAAADAANEKALARMTFDFMLNGETFVDTNLASYSTLVPSASDNEYWTNYTFLNAFLLPQAGATNSIYITPIYLNDYVEMTAGESQGMNAFQSDYSFSVFAMQTNNPYSNLLGGERQDVALMTIPLFQFAIFYNSLLEFTTAGVLTVTGPVHANSNIYVGSGNPLTFFGTVTATGVITNPAWAGDTQSDYTGPINYYGTPAPGVAAVQPPIYLPIGVSNNAPASMIQMLYPATVSDTFAMKLQRYYNKAEMLILVSNSTYFATNTLVVIKLQAPPTNGMSGDDTAPMWFTNVNPATHVTNAAWTANNFESWLSTTNNFYDFRQQQYMRVTQINVSNFNTWCSNSPCIYTNFGNTNKFSAGVPLNIIYVGDWRATNSTTNTAVRLMGGGSSNFPRYGLTVATPNPLYIWGNYDTPSTNNYNSTNVIGTYPTSFISDALTILSTNWLDSYSSSSLAAARPATNTTVNGAMITGVVYSTGSGGTGTTQYSGGVHNMPRLLENWGNGSAITLNTSMVNLYPSAVATAPFVWPNTGTVYGVPSTRGIYFNQNYTTIAGLPPGTPSWLQTQRLRQIMWGSVGNPP